MMSSAKRGKKVLDEDDFVENIEKIIERDFFPDYEQLKDHKEYLDAQEQKNFEKMRQLALKYSTRKVNNRNLEESIGRSLPDPSPASFETPIKLSEEDNHQNDTESLNLGYKSKEELSSDTEKMRSKDKNLSLDKFLGKYSSEDCESFKTIMDKTEEERRIKNAWLYEAEDRHKQMVHDMMLLEHEKEEKLAITSGEKGETSTNSSKRSQPPPTIPLNSWPYKAKNELMYYPEGNHRSKDDHLFKKPKLIQHNNTRFQSDPFKDVVSRDKLAQAVKENQMMCGERVGHDGKSILPEQSPKVNGFSFVSDSPSPMPGVADASPLMTWGEVGSTPARIDANVTPSPGPAFRFPEESSRDILAHKMVDDVMKKKKAKKEKALKQMKASVLGTPQFRSLASSERIQTLSPAARKLFGKRFTHGTDKMLKASYTPSPSTRRRTTTPFSTPSSSRRNTPHSTTTTPKSTSITDNLLNLSRTNNIEDKQLQSNRKTASDFF